MGSLTMFAYPWDFLEGDPGEELDRLADLGVDRLALALAYHSAEIISPRARAAVTVVPEANRAYVTLPGDAFSGLRLRSATLAEERPELVPAIVSAAAQRGMGLTAWVVALHNSDLAVAHPDAALRDCFGGTSAHGLCPANPSVRTYVRELVRSVAEAAQGDRVFLESASYLLAGHGHPHELRAVRLDPRDRLLLSLCFCDHCAARAEADGQDVPRLRARCAELLRSSWSSSLLAARAPDEGLELAALLVADPGVAAYARMRQEVVGSLVEEVATELRGSDRGLVVSSAVWGRPAPYGWSEGIDIGRCGAVAERFAVTTYHTDLADVARDLDHVLGLLPAERVMAVNTLWPEHHSSRDALLAKVAATLDAGVRDLGLYSLATGPAPLLEWTRGVRDLIGRAG